MTPPVALARMCELIAAATPARTVLSGDCGVHLLPPPVEGLREFLLGSVVGLAPRVVAVAVAGAGLAQLDLSRGADLRLAVLGAVATVALLVVLWAVGRRALREVTA